MCPFVRMSAFLYVSIYVSRLFYELQCTVNLIPIKLNLNFKEKGIINTIKFALDRVSVCPLFYMFLSILLD